VPVPEETPGLQGEGWRHNVFDFYTLEGAEALGQHLRQWRGGRLVLNVVEMPIKCPVAPLELVFLADWGFRKKHLRDEVEISFVTPLPLLKDSRLNHAGKLAFRWIYWDLLLRGGWLPVPTVRRMNKMGGIDITELYALFPNGPAKRAARIAGLTKPQGCV
jgi:hypothetical protein